jgi:hypothetical protein
LLGAEELVGFSPSTIASHYSKISIDIINKSIGDSDYRDFLNHFMHPDNCYALVNSTTLNAWEENLAEDKTGNIQEPLISLITDIFHSYQAFTPLSQYDRASLRTYIISAIPQNKISFTSKKLDESINVCTCLSTNIIK